MSAAPKAVVPKAVVPNLSNVDFHGPNYGYVLELYEAFTNNPNSVDPETQAFFQNWQPALTSPSPPNGSHASSQAATNFSTASNGSVDARPDPSQTPAWSQAPAQVNIEEQKKVIGLANLAQAIRRYGFLAAQLDPLGTGPPDDPALQLDYHSLTESDLIQLPCGLVGGAVVEHSQNSLEVINKLRQIYSTAIGFDCAQIRVPAERDWLQDAIESRRFAPPNDPVNPKAMLKRLTQVEAFEQFLQKIYPGKTRFSIEGLDMLVPILDEIIGDAAADGVQSILIGMAHRGRLNVLTHVLQKSYREIFTEFKDPVASQALSAREDVGWTGDVKYHEGASRALDQTGFYDEAPAEITYDVTIRMAPNPSHLELVNPVVEGMARADGTFSEGSGEPRFNHHISLPILIHGDAAFPGQGIVAETLNMARLDGYSTGGTIHIIANNQIGFTTDPKYSRSTLFASDLAKGFKMPIIHVNANDPVACMEVARIAVAYREEFQRDCLINLIGYRRHGHNEGDEPRFTQPEMYRRVDAVSTVREIWASRLVESGQTTQSDADQLLADSMNELQSAWDSLDQEYANIEPTSLKPLPKVGPTVDSAVPLAELRELHNALLDFPPDFVINSRIQRILRRRTNALEDPAAATIDWGLAEHLALAATLADGTSIRLTGEDVKRGTFSHRHAALFDANTGAEHLPLQQLPQSNAAFEIHNSPLTENATIGFEYGYNIQAPERLVIWEAQYGDFINGAQPVLDEFLVSGRAKWEQSTSLVLLLPHGYEGQGPDHSSARPERFLQMAAEFNMRVANCTTAAQYFHLLRRQAKLLVSHPRPLIVLTPKSLLRHPLAASTPKDLSEGQWQPVIDDPDAKPKTTTRLVLCSGKVYVDLVSSEQREKSLKARKKRVAIARVEQLYPFPQQEISDLFAAYTNLSEVLWVQEEPENMGAWEFVKPKLRDLLDSTIGLRYIGRPQRANPAEGSASWHAINQAKIVENAFS